jgi:hypothetical protein
MGGKIAHGAPECLTAAFQETAGGENRVAVSIFNCTLETVGADAFPGGENNFSRRVKASFCLIKR